MSTNVCNSTPSLSQLVTHQKRQNIINFVFESNLYGDDKFVWVIRDFVLIVFFCANHSQEKTGDSIQKVEDESDLNYDFGNLADNPVISLIELILDKVNYYSTKNFNV